MIFAKNNSTIVDYIYYVSDNLSFKQNRLLWWLDEIVENINKHNLNHGGEYSSKYIDGKYIIYNSKYSLLWYFYGMFMC